jgi:tRNA G18 (ribose-2'-O)-methylase SpoU
MPETTTTIPELKKLGYEIFAVEQAKGSIALQQFSMAGHNKLAIILGNEVDGVSEEALSLCNGCIEIPQWGSKLSLNVSVAACIVLWELVKQLQS